MVAGDARAAGFLLDSNVMVAAFEEEPRVSERLGCTPTEQIFVPAVAMSARHR